MDRSIGREVHSRYAGRSHYDELFLLSFLHPPRYSSGITIDHVEVGESQASIQVSKYFKYPSISSIHRSKYSSIHDSTIQLFIPFYPIHANHDPSPIHPPSIYYLNPLLPSPFPPTIPQRSFLKIPSILRPITKPVRHA